MQLDPRTLSSTAVYKLLISSVVPRPIAWVSSHIHDIFEMKRPSANYRG